MKSTCCFKGCTNEAVAHLSTDCVGGNVCEIHKEESYKELSSGGEEVIEDEPQPD